MEDPFMNKVAGYAWKTQLWVTLFLPNPNGT